MKKILLGSLLVMSMSPALSTAAVPSNPFASIQTLRQQAMTDKQNVNRAVLATMGINNYPVVRYMHVTPVKELGFMFRTYNDSPKIKELSRNPNAALLFLWNGTPRVQIRVTGQVQQYPKADSAHNKNYKAYILIPNQVQISLADYQKNAVHMKYSHYQKRDKKWQLTTSQHHYPSFDGK